MGAIHFNKDPEKSASRCTWRADIHSGRASLQLLAVHIEDSTETGKRGVFGVESEMNKATVNAMISPSVQSGTVVLPHLSATYVLYQALVSIAFFKHGTKPIYYVKEINFLWPWV